MWNYRKLVCTIIIAVIIISINFSYAFADNGENAIFSDVPSGHWAEESIYKLRAQGITDGIGNSKFGMGLRINRSEFAAFLVKLMKWELINPDVGSFADNIDKGKWYFTYIETALQHGAITKDSDTFRVDEPISREEMAVMIVRALGYENLSVGLSDYNAFTDVSNNKGYIAIAKDFGIIGGIGNGMFKPDDNATREQAAAMMMRMNDRLNAKTGNIHGFYAIKSANQIDKIKSLDSVGFGWSRLEYDNGKVVLNTTRKNNNEFAIPTGFFNPLGIAKENKTDTMLMVFADDKKLPDSKISLAEYIITEPKVHQEVAKTIADQVCLTVSDDLSVAFEGVVIDFENLRGEDAKRHFNVFLAILKKELDRNDKKMYVAVHPAVRPGRSYYDGYDFKTIGDIADKVILMAHDYNAKQLTDAEMEMGYTFTPLTPIDEIYWALKHITDENTGVVQKEKILIQLSFDSAQWKLKEGKVINKYPFTPDYETIKQRLSADDVKIMYSDIYENPYATFFNESDKTDNIVWYEDERSINAKIQLAKMFGIKDISLWRLGNIPDYKDTGKKKIYLDVWNQIFKTIQNSD